MRSLLRVSPNDDFAFAAAMDSGADAIILDLGNGPERMPDAEPGAARLARLRQRVPAPLVLVHLGRLTDSDLNAAVSWQPDGVFLHKAQGGRDIMRLSAMLAAREALAGLDDGTTRIVASPTDTPAGLFTLDSYRNASARLTGLAFGPDDLATALGAAGSRDDGGELIDPCRLARSLCLAAAAATGVQAIDGAFPDPGDRAGLEAEAAAARRDGFSAKIAIDPAQVPVINRIFADG